MTSTGARRKLHGRRSECEALNRLVFGARTGQSQVLVLRGEAGAGKTALLHYLAEHAPGCRVERAIGVQSERELAFAGLHQLCIPFLGRLDRLPVPQRAALCTAFGLQEGNPPDRFLVGVATLSLLSDVADERPLVCLVDDAQWLDRASLQALAFVARRLAAEPIAVVCAVREPAVEPDLAALPELPVPGLADADARALLESVVTGPLDERVRDRIVAESRGNPLALLELPVGPGTAELSFGFEPQDPIPPASRIEQSFLARLEPLPLDTRRLLLAAAVEPLGDVTLLWRAAELLGIAIEAAAPAEAAGLIEIGAGVRFRHPLVRSAAYRAADAQELQTVHHALAAATDAFVDPDRRAWHRARATSGLDEDVAAALEHSAGRARARGGLAAAAAFQERAVELTPDPRRRAQRALAAAQRKHQAGIPDSALRLLALARAGPLDELEHARAELLAAQITFAVTRGRDAPPLLLRAAKRLEPLDPRLARETYLDAFSAALSAARLADGVGVREVAAAVLQAEWEAPTEGAARACDLALDGLAILTTQGYAAGAPRLKEALTSFRREPMSEEGGLRWLWLACHIARALGDDAAWDELTDRQVRLARRAGALALLPVALTERFNVQLFAGDLESATCLIAEADTIREAAGSSVGPHGGISLAAWRGQVDEALTLIAASRQDVERRGEGLWLLATEWGCAVLFNGLGRYAEALAAAERAAEYPHELGLSTWVWPDLIEAAVRSGHAERAAAALPRLSEFARASGTDWALGVEARSRALLSEGAAAEALYREAVQRLSRTRIRVALARAHLVFGEWLRRERRRVDAREQLREAHEMFTQIGMDGFAERTRSELRATGDTARRRTVETVDQLTAQEAQIARLARERRTNPEIGAQLYLSPRTVEWHLRKVFTKLGISSRRQLDAALVGAGRG